LNKAVRFFSIPVPRRAAKVIVWLAAAFVATACNDGGKGVQDVPVIIYLVDTLRADRLGFYGYDKRDTSPHLDALAAQSVVFEQAYAPAPWTIPSVMSLHTSTFACEHGVENTRQALNSSFLPLAEHLRTLGYYGGAFYSNPIIGSSTGLDRGFAEFVGDFVPTREWTGDVDALITNAGNRPVFLYLHTMEPHDAYWTPYSFIRLFGHVGIDTQKEIEKILRRYNKAGQVDFRARQPIGTADTTAEQAEAMAELDERRETYDLLYDAAVRWADQRIDDVIGVLKKRGVWDKAIFIFLADHGEEIGDHGGWYHGQSVYDELVRAPLLIHFPGDEYAGRRISTPVSLVDVMPTIFDFLNRPEQCEDCRGKSLLPLIRDPEDANRGEFEFTTVRYNVPFYFRPWAESRGRVNVVIRQDAWKGIWNDDLQFLELYNLSSDPRELQDLAGANRAMAERMGEAARTWLEACRQRERMPQDAPELDRATLERLEALGYFD